MLSTLLSVPEVVLRLLVEPTLGGRTKGNGKTDRHLGADPGTAIQNGGQGLAAYSQRFCRLRNGDAKWLGGLPSGSAPVFLLPAQLLPDEGFHQAERTVEVRTGHVDEVVGSARQQLKLDLATRGSI